MANVESETWKKDILRAKEREEFGLIIKRRPSKLYNSIGREVIGPFYGRFVINSSFLRAKKLDLL